MASGTFTVTGAIGSGNTLTSKVFSNIDSFRVDIVNARLELVSNGESIFIDISAATTVTATLSAAKGNWTVTIS